MTNHVQWQETAMLVPHASGNVNGPWTLIDNPGEVGLIVPTLGTPCTVTIQVARDSSGTGASDLVDKAGAGVLVLASGSGGVAVSGNEMAAILAYPYMRVVLGANQGSDVTFYLEQKVPAVDNYA